MSAAVKARRWWVYVLATQRSPLQTYVGCTTDLERRIRQHNGLTPGGAARTRARRPWRVAEQLGPFTGRAEAQRLEARIKRLRGAERIARCREALARILER
jgi:putative endonuclease